MFFVELSRHRVFAYLFNVNDPISDVFCFEKKVFLCEIRRKWNDETEKYTNKMAGMLIYANSLNPF